MGQAASYVVPWVPDNITGIEGKTIVVTGANSGLGFEAALEFGKRGAKVLAVCRNEAKGKEALRQFHFLYPKGNWELIVADLADLKQVSAVAATINARNGPVDVLVNNAGQMNYTKREQTADGFESMMGVNYLAHFALTGQLMPSLHRSEKPRVVNVSCLWAWNGSLKGDVDFVIPWQQYRWFKTYCNSKLANLAFTYELGRRHPEITSVAAHAGITASGLYKYRLNLAFFKMAYLYPVQGVKPLLKVATEPEMLSGRYIGPWFGVRGTPGEVDAWVPRQARNPEVGKRLWAASVAATGVDY
jgi:NAD(P)-dependent dehydrogenase (short-subunit alcohol dehydrogenase family)